MPKFRVRIQEDQDIASALHHHGQVFSEPTPREVEVEAPDSSAALTIARKQWWDCLVIGEPELIRPE